MINSYVQVSPDGSRRTRWEVKGDEWQGGDLLAG